MYIYLFDITPVFLALVVFHIYHPGKVLVDAKSEYPRIRMERRQRREQKREAKREKKRVKIALEARSRAR